MTFDSHSSPTETQCAVVANPAAQTDAAAQMRQHYDRFAPAVTSVKSTVWHELAFAETD